MESIQIAKGPSSVLNGNEAITGQINMEYKKPTDEKPFFLNLFGSSHSQVEGNVISSLQLNPKWSTIILGHYSKKLDSHDNNKDGSVQAFTVKVKSNCTIIPVINWS